MEEKHYKILSIAMGAVDPVHVGGWKRNRKVCKRDEFAHRGGETMCGH